MFITFEGGEGSGKSTQIELLKNKQLQFKKKPIFFREPGGCPGSELIRNVIKDKMFVDFPEHKFNNKTTLLLMLAARNNLVNKHIKPLLEEGFIVICDRFFDSTKVYQTSSIGEMYDEKFCELLEQGHDGIVPDLTFLLDVDVDISMKRLEQRTIKDVNDNETSQFHKTIKEKYLELASNNERFVVIDSSRSVEQINEQILDIINEKLKWEYYEIN